MNHYIATSYFTCAHISSLFPLQNSALDQLVPCSVDMVTSGTKADCLKTKIYYTTLIRTTALPNELFCGETYNCILPCQHHA